MRFYEFARPLLEDTDESTIDNLVSVLNLIKYRMEKEDIKDRPVSFGTIVNLVRNSGVNTFGADDLIQAWDNNLAVQNLIARPTDKDSPVQFNTGIAEPAAPSAGPEPLGAPGPMGELGMIPPGEETIMPGSEMGEQEPTLPTSSGPPAGPTGDRQTVSQMADRALKRRQS